MQDINWKMFTFSDIYSKYDIRKPFVHRGYKYATDGRIMVRVPCDEVNTEGNFPPVDDIGWLHHVVSEWGEWPMDRDEEPYLIPHDCKGCDGCGYTGKHYEIDAHCRYCLTTNLDVAWLYAKRVALLPNPTFAIVEPERYDHPIVLFRFGENGEGILMPLGKE